MTKFVFIAAVAASLSASILASAPAEAHRRGRVVVADAVVAAPAAVVGRVAGCGAVSFGCGARVCGRPAYYDMSYPYVIPSMTPTFGARAPIGRCW